MQMSLRQIRLSYVGVLEPKFFFRGALHLPGEACLGSPAVLSWWLEYPREVWPWQTT